MEIYMTWRNKRRIFIIFWGKRLKKKNTQSSLPVRPGQYGFSGGFFESPPTKKKPQKMETPFHFFTFWGSAEKASMLDFLCARKKKKKI